MSLQDEMGMLGNDHHYGRYGSDERTQTVPITSVHAEPSVRIS
jgi:hypothetical protein